MFKKIKILVVLLVVLIATGELFSQSRYYNSLYSPIPVIKRLSYENFRNIKLLQPAMMNYGGGEAQLDKLVDSYAEASALYFRNKTDDAAKQFTNNEKEIFLVAKKLAERYRKDTEKLVNDGMKFQIKNKLKKNLKGERHSLTGEQLLGNSKYSVAKANDYYDRYINARKNVSAKNLISSIYYYRRAKENIITMLVVLEPTKEGKERIKEQYKRELSDNKNKLYKSMEKEN